MESNTKPRPLKCIAKPNTNPDDGGLKTFELVDSEDRVIKSFKSKGYKAFDANGNIIGNFTGMTPEEAALKATDSLPNKQNK